MPYTTCPLCSSDVRFEIQRTESNPEGIIYYCKNHGIFSVTSSVDQRLRSYKKLEARDSTEILRIFEQEVMRHTKGETRNPSYVPHFNSIEIEK